MKKRVFLHIGLPKTATSRVQTALHKNREALAEIGARYLQSAQHPLFRDNGHHILAVALMQNDWAAMQLHLAEDDIRNAWCDARSEIESSSAGAFIISSEWFSFGVHTEDQIEQLRDHLRGLDVHIVVALREVVGFANSLYAQRVRDGFAGTPADFIAETWPLLNWSDVTRLWGSAFGANNVIALNFDTARRDGDPLESFLKHTVGVPAKFVASGDAPVNQTLPVAATELMRLVNQSTAAAVEKEEFRDLIKAFFERNGRSFEGGNYFSDEAREMLSRRCVWPHTVN